MTNLNVIAAVVIGGTASSAVYGTIFGTVVGLFIPAVLQYGFVIVGVSRSGSGVAVGAVLVAAVYVDQTRRAAACAGRSRRTVHSGTAAPGVQVKGRTVSQQSSSTAGASATLLCLPPHPVRQDST